MANDPNGWVYSAADATWQSFPDLPGLGTFMFRATAYYF